jgi:nucleotide-binding universal stress UspA family protein
VGIDGSKESRRALHWALKEAALRGASLRVVHSFSIPPTVTGPGTAMAPQVLTETIDADRAAAATLLRDELSAADAASAGVTIESVVAEGPASAALLEAAKGADLIVVGSRGRGGFKGLLLGSVSNQTAHHAPCPVVIVRHELEPA